MFIKPSFTLIQTKQPSKPTIQPVIDGNKYLLYSKYNPTRDSKAFAEKHYSEHVENYLIYGLGLGYHIN